MAKQSWWSRFWSIFNAKAHKSLDKLEDNARIDILRQKVRELEAGHGKSINGLAKVKALEIKFRSDAKGFENRAIEYREKAEKLKSRYQTANKNFESATKKADKDAYTAEINQHKSDIILMLNKAENMDKEAATKITQAENQVKIVENLEVKIKEMATRIKATKANITNMEARAEAAKINKEISKELSDVNFDGLSSQIEEIEKKITEDNAEAEAWDHIDTAMEDDEDRIEKMLNEPSVTEDSKLFEDFMSK